jgi:membrane protease YdiL (CAAX protease family)
VNARAIFYAPSGTLRAPWRIGGFLLVFFAAKYALFAVAGGLPRPGSFIPNMMEAWIVLLASVLLATFIMLRRVDDRAWSTIGLGRANAAPSVMTLGLIVGALGILIPSGALLAAHWLQVAPPARADGSSLRFGIGTALLFLPQSLSEELLSRGYAFSAVREAIGPVWALVLSSLVFGGLHLYNPGANARSFAIVVLAGVWLGSIVVLTRSVYAAWMAHFAWNAGIVSVLHAPVSGIPFPAPDYTIVSNGPEWATGGSWGPEGSVFAAIAMLASIYVVYRWTRARGIGAPELAHG